MTNLSDIIPPSNVVTDASTDTLTNKTLTSPKINEDVAVTSTATELNVLDGITAVVGELNALDLGSTAVGTAIASKAVILDANKDYSGLRNLTISGELDAATLDVSGDVDIDGTLEADAITVNGTSLAETISDTVGGMVGSNTETGITVTYQDGDNTLDFALGAAQTGITSLLATDIKIGEDDQTKIDFETADEIHFYAANVEQVYLGDNIFGPQSDSDVDLGSTGVRWKDAFVDSITVTGEVDAASLDISGDVDVDGTLETDNLTIGGAQGSNGQILTSTGSGVGWANAAAGGTNGLKILSTVTASNSATVNLETTFNSTYDDYVIMISGVKPVSDAVNLILRTKVNGSYQTANYKSNNQSIHSQNTSATISGNQANGVIISLQQGNASTETGNFKVYISNVHGSGYYKMIHADGSYMQYQDRPQGGYSIGAYSFYTTAVTGVQFLFSSGNISTGTFRVYGVSKS
jgi:cytoskeletal protein CcmA (bactofilin family)